MTAYPVGSISASVALETLNKLDIGSDMVAQFALSPTTLACKSDIVVRIVHQI